MNERAHAHFLSPRLRARPCPSKGGYTIVAIEPVPKGELLVVWGGDIMTGAELAVLPAAKRRYSIQIEENLYQVSPHESEAADYINHSCSPNAGLSGPISLVAMREIRPGQEVHYDYATSDGSAYDEFACACGARNCRGRVSGDDWRLPLLQRRYRGYFSPYLQRRINRLRGEKRQHAAPALAGLAQPSIAAFP